MAEFADSFREEVEVKKAECIQCCKKDIAKLMAKLSSKTRARSIQSFRDIGEAIERHDAEKKQTSLDIDEIRNRKRVFLHYCQEIEIKLSKLRFHDSNYSSVIGTLYSTFKREARRYDNQLPIYSHRLGILDTVKSNQVSILIGETGSGKSTQLVQYLYEAGYSSNGLIACTQPRKLAAHSLAKHVSKEVDEYIGDTYDFIDSKGKWTRSARVLFMTDFTLLNFCIADPNLKRFSCLVIDEAHERSIHTDILIALIKRCLPHRPDLKVIITSATINPTLFSKYFGGENECPIISVPGRVYPVKVIWTKHQSSMLKEDYVFKAVRKVYDIHERNEPGDVLVFLTCPAEIERACKYTQQLLENEVIILQLHGKLQPEEQQKVFERTLGQRKVIFSTNVAETSITIPGIVYVVDTGLSKECCYDPQKNMNSLEIRPISKSSADQRKGRAGRTCPGECYRLYTEEDYKNMKDNSVPEILRITLALAVIKLYEFGIKDVHTFEFVESPNRKALEDAVKNLKFLGAIKQDRLTELGKEMAMLPLEPNLSKVLLEAIDKGIGLEAAIAVSMSTLAGRVFFRPDTAESRAESDKKMLPFCQPTGDQMTYLHTYIEWSYQQGNWRDQKRWCMENFVNAKSMRMVEDIVEELRLILYHKRYIKLPTQITSRSLQQADALLPKLFFDAFSTNICIHLGYSNAVGYWSEKIPAAQLVIHPGSSLKQLNSVPQYLVYETTNKTSQHFLLQALPVREEWIQEAVECGKLMCHPADHPLFEVYKPKPLTFANGPWIAKKLRYTFDRRISISDFDNFEVQPVFEHSKQNGTLTVFAQLQNHDEVQNSVHREIESLKQELRVDIHKCRMAESRGNVKIVAGRGGCIVDVVMPGEVQTIVVRGIENEEEVSKVKAELDRYGECAFNSSKPNEEKNIQLFVKYQNPSAASEALNHRFVSFPAHKLKILRRPDKSRRNYSLKLEWCRRKRKDFAYISFSSDEEFDSLVHPFFSEHQFYEDPSSKLTFTRSIGRSSIRVTGRKLKLGVSEDYVVSQLLSFLPECEQTDFSVIFIYHDEQFEETRGSLRSQKNRLEEKLEQCTSPHYYTVIMDRLQPKRVMYKAWIYFDSFSECIKTYRFLSEEIAQRGIEDDEDSSSESDDSESSSSDDIIFYDDDYGDFDDFDDYDDSSEDESDWETDNLVYAIPSKVELSLRYSAWYTPKFFLAIAPTVLLIQQKFLLEYSCVMIDWDKKDKWDNVCIRLSSSDDEVFQLAKAKLEKAAEPTVVSCETELQNQYISTAAFSATLTELQEKTSTFMKINSSHISMASIAIYGAKTSRKSAKRELQSHLKSISHSGIQCFDIDLKVFNPGLMKLLVQKYGYDAKLLSNEYDGIVATRITPNRHKLTLFATEAASQPITSLLSTLNPLNIIAQVVPIEQTKGTEETCCACQYTKIYINQIQQESYYQLEICGHVYCIECIELQLQSNTIRFPVMCAAENCGEQLVWKDFENLFKRGIKTHQEIESASLRAYIISNPHKVRNCITPDCEMIYFVTKSTAMYVCDRCDARICSCCHAKWHEGFTCEESESIDKPNQSLQVWMDKDPVNHRRCQHCDTVIQKIGGCQHLECCCGCHICWICMEGFPTQQECYGHLQKAHSRFV